MSRKHWLIIFIVGFIGCSAASEDRESTTKTEEYTAFHNMEIVFSPAIDDTALIGHAMDYALEYYDREDAGATVLGSDDFAYIYAGEFGKITGNDKNRDSFTIKIEVKNQDSLKIISGSIKGKYTDTPPPLQGEYVDMAPQYVNEQEKYLKEWMEKMISSFKTKNDL